MNNIKQNLLSKDLAAWKKKGIFSAVCILSIFPFVITYRTSMPELEVTLWSLRHFIGIAVVQALAQISISWYMLKNVVPNYVIGSFLVVVILSQFTYGIAVVLVSSS
ncbi:hypothetical protein [Marinobacterium jannaschii]|uniref:hypothetical protein n=1 Tax=Marinobacterium jannaschii TaxID=64970 RepID=UPI0012EBA128|nr:hypothetical protein [Marinobacterium jannaschii]